MVIIITVAMTLVIYVNECDVKATRDDEIYRFCPAYLQPAWRDSNKKNEKCSL